MQVVKFDCQINIRYSCAYNLFFGCAQHSNQCQCDHRLNLPVRFTACLAMHEVHALTAWLGQHTDSFDTQRPQSQSIGCASCFYTGSQQGVLALCFSREQVARAAKTD